jgi:hypothetical protein
VFGVIYSKFGDLGPRPEIWAPKSLEYDTILEILLRSTCFISIDLSKMHDRLAVFPFPEYNMVGMTYYYVEQENSPQEAIASITLLINEHSQEFVNCNSTNIKANLRTLTRQLNDLSATKEQVLNQYLFELEDLITGYKSLEKIREERDQGTHVNKAAILLSYFHSKIGPMPFYMYPDIPFDEKNKDLISKELELSINEGFFTRTYPEFVALHHYFELPSKLARGKSEMCLLTFIFENLPSQEMISHISFNIQKLFDALKAEPDISYGFYKTGYSLKEKKDTIDKMYLTLQEWVKKVYEVCIEKRDLE